MVAHHEVVYVRLQQSVVQPIVAGTLEAHHLEVRYLIPRRGHRIDRHHQVFVRWRARTQLSVHREVHQGVAHHPFVVNMRRVTL
jgi:hypothetical protein